MAPLRVVHVYKDVHPPIVGGVEKHIDLLRREMTEVVSHVLVPARRARTAVAPVERAREVRVAELGPRWLGVPVAPAFPLWLRRLDADIVHLHMPNPLGEASALLAAGHRPLILSYHADIVRQARAMRAYRPLVLACCRRASAVIVGSLGIARTSPLLRCEEGKLVHVPYGVDLERYSPDAVSEGERAELRRRYGAPLVLTVARLVYYKGLEHLIEAARRVDAAVVIVGGGPLEESLRELAAGTDNVHLTGEVSEEELVRHLAAADCFVLPSTSRAESFGIATLEAQAMGVPAIVTDVGTGTLEAIAPGESGLVVPPADAAALAAAIDEIISSPERASAMASAARERVERLHSSRRQAERILAVYSEALRG